MPTPAETVRIAIPEIEMLDAAPKRYPWFLTDAFIREHFFKKADASGLKFTDQQRANVTVEKSVIRSPDFVKLKTVLGFGRRDDAMSQQLEQALRNPVVIDAINAYIEKYGATIPDPNVQAAPPQKGIDAVVPVMVPPLPVPQKKEAAGQVR